MVESYDREKFLAYANEEKAGVIVLKPTEISFFVETVSSNDKKQERDIYIKLNGENYRLGRRALKNLQKLTGISRRLLNELPLVQLMNDLNSQIQKISALGLVTGTELVGEITARRIIALFNSSKFSYIGYIDLLAQVQDKIVFVKGNPLEDDFIQIQFKGFETDEFLSGINILLSSTNIIKSTVSVGVIEKKAGLSWRDTVYKKFDQTGLVADDFVTLQNTMQGDPEFVVTLNKGLLAKADEIKIQNEKHLEGILESVPGRKFREVVQKTYTDPVANQKLLTRVGIEKIETVKDIFRVLIFFSTNAPNNRLNLSTGTKFFEWLYQTSSAVV